MHCQKKKDGNTSSTLLFNKNVAAPRILHLMYLLCARQLSFFFWASYCTASFFTLQKLFNSVFVAAFTTKRITVSDSWRKLWAQHLPSGELRVFFL